MRHRLRILYLEDDVHLGDLTASVLEKEGFDVHWETNGLPVLDLLNRLPFDICVVDIMMPKIDGYSLVKAIREKNTQIPVIFLSARVLTEDVLKGFEVGGNDYMRKPFSVEELIARIRQLTTKARTVISQPELIYIGGYTYNHSSFELRGEHSKVFLSSRSGELLYRLCTNRDGLLLKKDTLMELWGDDSFFNGRSLDVFITKLRHNLSADSRIRIVNLRGQGYKLIVEADPGNYPAVVS